MKHHRLQVTLIVQHEDGMDGSALKIVMEQKLKELTFVHGLKTIIVEHARVRDVDPIQGVVK